MHSMCVNKGVHEYLDSQGFGNVSSLIVPCIHFCFLHFSIRASLSVSLPSGYPARYYISQSPMKVGVVT